MKLKFKHQPFQADAARAVTDVFEGQQIIAGQAKYLMDTGGSTKKDMAGQMLFGGSFDADGWKNARIQDDVRAHLLERIIDIQKTNGIKPSPKLEGEGINLTVEMETGVGKTYTYIKTIHELYRKYLWMKFIIVVPSIAIREGVAKSFKDLEEHFLEEYGRKINSFVYNSSRLGELDIFAKDSGIHVMIINSQAFAKSFDGAKVSAGGGTKEARIIFSKQDSMGGRRPIDVIAAMQPIVIIDEPQSVEGPATKQALKLFNALFMLRYSATHRDLYNLIYRLDAVDALKQKLVKEIAVKGITQTGTSATDGFLFLEGINTFIGRAPEAMLRFDMVGKGTVKTSTSRHATKGFDLYQQSGGLTEYKHGYVVMEIDATRGVVEFQNGLVLQVGQTTGAGNEMMLRRIQIRETIKTHFEREEYLFSRGIKCLSLFFIDEVAKYRVYEDGIAEPGEYVKVFEEEYEAHRRDLLLNHLRPLNKEYEAWLSEQDASGCHAGYFSIDKKSKRLVDPKLEAGRGKRTGTGTSNDVDAFDLIMKGKERLLSFDDPEGGRVRFLFSHSALREGWDNPNVFQICTLRESTAEIRKRQEVGRGLRLCVNKFGERQDVAVLGDGIYDVNTLTVIASESYESFARGLQSEVLETLGDRPVKVTQELFAGQDFTHKDGSKSGVISRQMASNIWFGLVTNGYVDKNGQLTAKYEADKAVGKVDVGEDISSASVVKILDEVFNPTTIKPKDALKGRLQQVNVKKLNSREFLSLWSRINSKSAYTVTFDSADLVRKCASSLDSNLRVPAIEFIVKSGTMKASQTDETTLKAGTAMGVTSIKHEQTDAIISSSYRCDLIGQIVDGTGLTRKDVADILMSIDKNVFGQFKSNPEAFIRRAVELINEQKGNVIVEKITYNKIEGRFETDIFSDSRLRAYPGARVIESPEKGVYDMFILDSDVEQAFCKDLEASAEVVVYTKLPKSFAIDTPVGQYNPDWAIVFESNGEKEIYFVAETKGTLNEFGLDRIEQSKIACARKHFAAIASGVAKYEFVNTYANLHNILMSLKG